MFLVVSVPAANLMSQVDAGVTDRRATSVDWLGERTGRPLRPVLGVLQITYISVTGTAAALPARAVPDGVMA